MCIILIMAVKVIAEIGCVHLGQMDRAKMMINLAHYTGADYAKFQKRNPVECIPKDIQDKPHPNQKFAYGDTYLKHREALEFNIEQHVELKSCCASVGIGYAVSVWDVTSAREMASLNPDYIKVPSACNANWDMLDILFKNYGGLVHISTGMTSQEELESLKEYLDTADPGNRAVIYHCTSEYPCPHNHLYLNEILRHRETFKPRHIGFSNHGYGIAMDLLAFMLGAWWIERHFVDDRTLNHTDAAASLEPDGMRKLCRDLKAADLALQYKEEMSEDEISHRRKLKL